jgi:mycothiol synthase
VEVDLVVHPSARRRGVGTALAEAVVAGHPEGTLSAWSHGNHPAAAALAQRFGFTRVRDLWVMRLPLTDPLRGQVLPVETPSSPGVVVRAFEPGRDEEAFLALNAEAFAGHPEQGRMTRADLDQRMAEPWFDPEGFFVAEARSGDAGELLGFHWTKVHPGEPPHGEVYVVGVSPKAQGMGLGRLLTLTGLQHLAARGLEEAILYVESDNAPAIAVYSGLGFTHADSDTHVMYRRG